MEWTPITKEELDNEIEKSVSEMDDKTLRFWNSIKIVPKKWFEKDYGIEGGGFWVVGLIGSNVIWYNDIEDGFNISKYSKYGTIDEYYCNQDELKYTIWNLRKIIFDKEHKYLARGAPTELTI